jgi:hypothetical protein
VHVAELEQRLREIRLERERQPQAALGLLELAPLAQQRGDIDVHVGELRHQLGGAAVGGESRIGVADVAIGGAQVVVRLREIGLELDGAAQGHDPFRHAPGLGGRGAARELLLR